MSKIIKYLLFISLIFVVVNQTAAQLNPQQARQKLKELGHDEDEVIKRMMDRGIDLKNLNVNNPAESARAEVQLAEVIAEMDAEKAAEEASEKDKVEAETIEEAIKTEIIIEEQSKDIAKEAEDISESIKEGASIEEAVAEELTEIANESNTPPSSIYGQEIFRNQSIKLYRQSEDVKPPDSYVLGVGDKVGIQIWGYIEENLNFEISKDGYIKPTGIPRIFLKGITIGSAKKLLLSRFQRYYRFRPDEFEVTLNSARTINVTITGEVFNYGSFNIPAINTAFNALVAAGGPNDLGSVRNIMLIRAGEVPRQIDVYKYLQDPSKAQEFYLRENDLIHVPIADKIVRIAGPVYRPLRYELLKNENLIDLIDLSGGLKPNAFKNNIQVKRFQADKELITDVALSDLLNRGGDYKLFNGDVVTINKIPDSYKNFVTISGPVEIDGQYALDGRSDRLSSIVNRAVLKPEAILSLIYVVRLNDDKKTVSYIPVNLDKILKNPNFSEDLILQPQDKIIISSKRTFVDEATISINGAVRNPNTFAYDQEGQLRVSDAVFLAGGLKENAYNIAYITRKDTINTNQSKFIRVDLDLALRENPDYGDFLLAPNDVLNIYSKDYFQDALRININGAVRNPGEYKYDPFIKIGDLVTMAGGTVLDASNIAYIQRIDSTNLRETKFIRVDLANEIDSVRLYPNDVINIYSKSYFSDDAHVTISGSVRNPGEFRYDENLKLLDVLTMAGGLKMSAAHNRIDVYRVNFENDSKPSVLAASVEVDETLNIVGNAGFYLHPFDQIVVRNIKNFEFQQMVQISGEVSFPGSYSLIGENERISDLIERSGGLTEEAFLEGATLFRSENDIGYVVLELDKILSRGSSESNMILKRGDVIQIPKRNNVVTITGAVNLKEVFTDQIAARNKISAPYFAGKSAKFYVDEFGGGVAEYGAKRDIHVVQADGAIKRTKNFLFFKRYPRVEAGSTIVVGRKPVKEEKLDNPNESKTDWGEVVGNTVAQATSVLTLILLLQRLD